MTESVTQPSSPAFSHSDRAIPVIQEEPVVSSQSVDTGGLRITKRAEEIERLVEIHLDSEQLIVERKPGSDQLLDAAPSIREDGDFLVVPVVEEVVIITRKVRVIEELRIQRVRTSEVKTVTVPVMSETVELSDIVPSSNRGR